MAGNKGIGIIENTDILSMKLINIFYDLNINNFDRCRGRIIMTHPKNDNILCIYDPRGYYMIDIN